MLKKLLKLRVRVRNPDEGYQFPFDGEEATVEEIGRWCSPSGWGCVIRVDSEPDRTYRWSSDDLEPLEIGNVPESHRVSKTLINAWVFHEAMCDAWIRDQKPPKDMTEFEEKYGMRWTDTRTYEIRGM